MTVTHTLTQAQTRGRAKALDRLTGQLATRYPQHTALVNRARGVYEGGKLHLTSSAATVDGCNGNVYTLTPIGKDVWSCTCPAYEHRPAEFGEVRHCKHTAALRLMFLVEGGF